MRAISAQSTLLLQVAALLVAPDPPAASPAGGAAEADAAAEELADAEVEAGSAVLYVSAEESVEQVRGLLPIQYCSEPKTPAARCCTCPRRRSWIRCGTRCA